MRLNPVAAVMSLISSAETDSAAFYRERAAHFPEMKELFSAWAAENKKFEKRVKQTYFGVITDAIESTFSFAQLDTSDCVIDTSLSGSASVQTVKEKASEIEKH